jgi:hypothetical protein
MSPAEAAAATEEPDWAEMFRDFGGEFSAYQATLFQWRRWHAALVLINGEEKRNPAPATDGIIALAQAGVLYPSLTPPRPPGVFEEQSDAHCWLISQDRAWRILGVEDGMLMLNSFGDEWQIDLGRAKWAGYVEKAAAALETQRRGETNVTDEPACFPAGDRGAETE